MEPARRRHGLLPDSGARLCRFRFSPLGSRASTGSPEEWDWLRQEVPKAIAQSREGIRRMSKILGAMRRFSTPAVENESRSTSTKRSTQPSSSSRTRSSTSPMFKPTISPTCRALECYADEMNQVFLNLIVNATHAIREASKKQARRAWKAHHPHSTDRQ